MQLFMQNNKNNRTETHVNVATTDNGHSGQNMLVENVNDLSTPRPAISSENSNDTMSNVLNAVASLAKSYSGMQDTINQLLKSTQTEDLRHRQKRIHSTSGIHLMLLTAQVSLISPYQKIARLPLIRTLK